MTSLQKGFSHREEAKSAKIFKNPKNFLGFLSFFFAIIKIPSRSPWHCPSGQVSPLRGKKRMFLQWTHR
jgi:hypothetical protein